MMSSCQSHEFVRVKYTCDQLGLVINAPKDELAKEQENLNEVLANIERILTGKYNLLIYGKMQLSVRDL